MQRIVTVKWLVIGCLMMSLAACSGLPDWMGQEEKDPVLEGERVSALRLSKASMLTPELQDVGISLPSMERNDGWGAAFIQPVAHPALAANVEQKDSTSIGAGADDLPLSPPVVAAGMVITLDAEGSVRAHGLTDIDDERWEYDVPAVEGKGDVLGLGVVDGFRREKDFLSGALAADERMVVVVTRRGQVIALDPQNGTERWQKKMRFPVMSAPSIGRDHVYLVTSDVRLYALNRETGDVEWSSLGLQETTSQYGMPTAVPGAREVFAAFPSGEVKALRQRTGDPLWVELLGGGVIGARASTGSIDVTPVETPAGLLVASDQQLSLMDRQSGFRLWQKEIAVRSTPQVSGNWVFVLTEASQLLALRLSDGKVRWVQDLVAEGSGTFGMGSQKLEHALWFGPTLAGGNLYVVHSAGRMLVVDAKSGQIQRGLNIPDHTLLPPIVAEETLLVLSDNGTLTAFAAE